MDEDITSVRGNYVGGAASRAAAEGAEVHRLIGGACAVRDEAGALGDEATDGFAAGGIAAFEQQRAAIAEVDDGIVVDLILDACGSGKQEPESRGGEGCTAIGVAPCHGSTVAGDLEIGDAQEGGIVIFSE